MDEMSSGPSGPLRTPADVLEGIEAVRLSGITNMLDLERVAELAIEFGHPEAALWIHEHRDLYAQGIVRGFEPNREVT
jgi:uncharacterized protein DUF5049